MTGTNQFSRFNYYYFTYFLPILADGDPDFILSRKRYEPKEASMQVVLRRAAFTDPRMVVANQLAFIHTFRQRPAGYESTFKPLLRTARSIERRFLRVTLRGARFRNFVDTLFWERLRTAAFNLEVNYTLNWHSLRFTYAPLALPVRRRRRRFSRTSYEDLIGETFSPLFLRPAVFVLPLPLLNDRQKLRMLQAYHLEILGGF